MKLQKMRLEDINQVSKLYQEANQFTTVKNIHNWTIEGLNKFPQLNFVIEDGQKIIGAISAILKNKKGAVINDIAVLREYQSKHVGSRLMERLLKELKRQEVKNPNHSRAVRHSLRTAIGDFYSQKWDIKLRSRAAEYKTHFSGIEKITLWVHWKNSRAIPFYYRSGFKMKRVSQTQNIPGVPDGEDIIHLEREL